MPKYCTCQACGKIFPSKPSKSPKFCSQPCWWTTKHQSTPALERFWSRVNKTADCWLWTAGKLRQGYGSFRVSKPILTTSHQYAWEMRAGPVPEGLFVCHTCDVRPCVRNDDHGVYIVSGVAYERWGHLWLGDAAANSIDMTNKGRHWKGRG